MRSLDDLKFIICFSRSYFNFLRHYFSVYLSRVLTTVKKMETLTRRNLHFSTNMLQLQDVTKCFMLKQCQALEIYQKSNRNEQNDFYGENGESGSFPLNGEIGRYWETLRRPGIICRQRSRVNVSG